MPDQSIRYSNAPKLAFFNPKSVHDQEAVPKFSRPVELLELSDETLAPMQEILRANLSATTNCSSWQDAHIRRSLDMLRSYNQSGAVYIVAVTKDEDKKVVGGVGLCSLARLPQSDGIGEIRDLVVDAAMRGQGIGRALLSEALRRMPKMGYNRIYLETAPNMHHAKKLFEAFGFRALKTPEHLKCQNPGVVSINYPCYYIRD